MRPTFVTRSVGGAAAAALFLPLALATPAHAKDTGNEVRRSGSCSGGGNWELKAKFRDGRIEWEFEVDTNRSGQRWNVTVTDNGKAAFSGTRTTGGPSGSFSVERHTADSSGSDVIRATATRGESTCKGRVTV